MSLPRLAASSGASSTATDPYSQNRRTALQFGSGGDGGGVGAAEDFDSSGFGGFGGIAATAALDATMSRTARGRPANGAAAAAASAPTSQPTPATAAADASAAAAAAVAASPAAVQQAVSDTMMQYKQLLSSHGGPSSSSVAAAASAASGPPTGSAPGAALPAHMSTVRSLHSSVQATLGAIQGKTSLILQEQERDLLRAFKLRLGDVVAELERERKKNESGSVEWVQRCRSLTEQLQWQQELTSSLSSENKHLLSDNRRMARVTATMEADRAFLIRQLVGVKKENARLRFLVEQQIKENQELGAQVQQQLVIQQQQQQLLMPGTAAGPGASGRVSPSPLTQRSLAAHNGGAASGATPVPPLKLPSNFQSGALIPANMRQSLLAAATTEGALPASAYSGGLGASSASQAMMSMMQAASGAQTQRPATSSDYMPPTTASGGRSASGAQTARLASTMPPTAGGAHGPQAHPPLPEARISVGQEARFKSVIASLKRRLEQAQTEARAAKTAFVQTVQAQTQLQHLFKQCVDSVREQSAARRAAAGGKAGRGGAPSGGSGLTSLPPSGLDPRSSQWFELSPEERASVLEWMLSQQAVLALVFDKMFPTGPSAAAAAAGTTAAATAGAGAGAGVPMLYGSNSGQQQQQQHGQQVGLHFDYVQFMAPKGANAAGGNSGGYELAPSSRAQRGASDAATAAADDDEQYEHILLPSGMHPVPPASSSGGGGAGGKRPAAATRPAYSLSPRSSGGAGFEPQEPVQVDYFAPDDQEEQRAAQKALQQQQQQHPPAQPPVKPTRSAVQVQHIMPRAKQHAESKE